MALVDVTLRKNLLPSFLSDLDQPGQYGIPDVFHDYFVRTSFFAGIR